MTKAICNVIQKLRGFVTRVVGWVASCVRRTDWQTCAWVVEGVAFPCRVFIFLLNSFCLTQVTHVQIHATPNSSSENSSNECMTKAQASQGAKYSTSQRYDGEMQCFVAIVWRRYDEGNIRFYLEIWWFCDTRRRLSGFVCTRNQTAKLVQEMWRVLHVLADLKQFLFNCFCPTHVRDRNTYRYVQIHATPKSS